MNKNRLEAFSDGVMAIIITIMVLELHIPELSPGFTKDELWSSLGSLLPQIAAYLLSFVVVAILWLNHHALFDQIPHSDPALFWYNAFLLFSMSLIPIPTAFLAEHPLLEQASMLYGLVMFLNALAFLLLRRYAEIKAKWIPYNRNIHISNRISTVLYLVSIPISIVSVYFSLLIFIGIPMWYFIPERFTNRKK